MAIRAVISSTLAAALLVAVLALGPSAARATTGHSISGTIWASAPGTPVEGALISACPTPFDTPCRLASSAADGTYSLPNLPDRDWTLTVSPPGSGIRSATLGPITVSGADVTGQNAILRAPTPPPSGTSVNDAPPGEIPLLAAYGRVHIVTTGCDGGLAIWTLTTQYGGSEGHGLFETSPGTYVADSLVSPLIGPARVKLTIGGCPTIEFDVNVVLNDVVRDTFGVGVSGATVTLYRSDDPDGPFVQVPDGSPLMTPVNRTNPDLTDGNGHFGWDALAGYYKVTSEKAGCTDPADGDSVAESDIQAIPRPFVEPPPFLDVLVVLDCGPPNYPPVLGGMTTFSAFSSVPFSGDVTTFSDADLLESAADFSARIDWGDGTPPEIGSITGVSGSFTVKGGGHAYAVPGVYPVRVVVTETATGATTYGFAFAEVATLPPNEPPVVVGTTINATSSIPFSGTIATFEDDYGETPAEFAASIDWGDGSPPDTGSIIGGSGSFAVGGGHTYAAPGSYTVTVVVTDTAIGEQSDGVTFVEVAALPNEPPVVAGTTIDATSGVPFSGTVATFADADVAEAPADFMAAIEWGDGSPLDAGSISGGGGSFVVSDTHTYASPGHYTVTVVVTETATGSTSSDITDAYVAAPPTQRQLTESLLAEVVAQRDATPTNRWDYTRLRDAAKVLGDAVNPLWWLDGNHPNPKGGEHVFDGEKAAVGKLRELLKDSRSAAIEGYRDVLRGWIGRLVGIDRTLASTAIAEATAGGGTADKLRAANAELARGDESYARDDPADAIEHYKKAWQQARDSTR